MTRHLEAIDKLWDALSGSPNADRVGFCLDTCHAHASGLGLDGLLERVKAITGRVDVVHCNDSRDEAGSGADRHANLGQGLIDGDALAALVREADTVTLLETPGGVPERALDLTWLRQRL